MNVYMAAVNSNTTSVHVCHASLKEGLASSYVLSHAHVNTHCFPGYFFVHFHNHELMNSVHVLWYILVNDYYKRSLSLGFLRLHFPSHSSDNKTLHLERV